MWGIFELPIDMKNKRILYVTPEFVPYFSETSISDMAFEVSKIAHHEGAETRVFMPKFGLINERRFQLHEVIRLSGMNLIVNDLDVPLIIKVASVPGERMQVYFIDNDDYFKRKATFLDEDGKLFQDNDERMIFFVKGVVEAIKKLNWSPDIIHLYGWETALFPLYLKTYYKNEPILKESKIVTSLSDNSFEGSLSESLVDKIKFDNIKGVKLQRLKDPTYINLIKNAIYYSDAVIQNEPDIDCEIISFIEENKKPLCLLESENFSSSDCLDFYRRELLPPEVE